jgi:branched-subunit amino acid ABC-type transport system permease component
MGKGRRYWSNRLVTVGSIVLLVGVLLLLTRAVVSLIRFATGSILVIGALIVLAGFLLRRPR